MPRRKALPLAILVRALFAALGAGPALASDQTIVGINTFVSLDGSARDDVGPAIPVAVAAAAAFTAPAQAAITITKAHAHVAPQRQAQGR
jgi:hypothetical protein